MANNCPECGQMMGKDRELCERCERMQRVEELEREVEGLRAKAAIHDRIRELLALGLSSAQALDVAHCYGDDALMKPPQWADIRGVSPAAVYNNIADAREIVDAQTALGDFEEQPESESDSGSGNTETTPEQES